MAKTISDEQIISALLSKGTQRAAAAAVGISERALFDRMNDGEFQALYKAAKADLVRQTVVNINAQLQAAIDTVAEVMQNQENNPAVRLQAAQTILNTAGKFAQQLQKEETNVTIQVDNNTFAW